MRGPAEETGTNVPERNPRIDVRVDRDIEMPELAAKDEERAPRRVCITRAMLDKYGYTDGCPGCTVSAIGGTGVVHNEECRIRIEGEMNQGPEHTEKLRTACEKRHDSMDKHFGDKAKEEIAKREVKRDTDEAAGS